MKLSFKMPSFARRDPAAAVLPGTGRLAGLQRNLRKWAPWIAGTFGLLLLFTWLSLPTRALAWRISHECKRRGYVVDIEDISVSPFGGVTLENVAWTFEPSRPDQIPAKFVAEEVDIDVSLLSMLIGNVDVDIEAAIDEGTLEANYSSDDDEDTFSLEVRELPLYAIPKASQAFNAPLLGTFEMKIELVVPEHKYAQAHGEIELSCTACRVGDGESLLFVPGARGLMAKGVTIPEIDLGTLGGKMVIKDGVGEIQEAIETKSEDVEVSLTGKVELADPFRRSRFDLVMKLNLTESLQQRSEPIKLMVQTAGKSSKLDPPEQGLGFRLSGPLSRPRFRGIKSKSREERLRERRDKARKRADKRRKKKKKKKKKKDKDEEAPQLEITPSGDDKTEGGEGPKIGEPITITPVEPSAAPMPSQIQPPEMPMPPPAEEPQPEEQPQEEAPAEGEEQPQTGGQPEEGQGTGEGAQQGTGDGGQG